MTEQKKQCLVCEAYYPLTRFPQAKNRCKHCVAAEQAKYRAARKARIIRTCTACEMPKTLHEFLGRNQECLECNPESVLSADTIARKHRESAMAGFNPTIQRLLSQRRLG